MALYYSESTKGFYDTDFADYDLPADVQEITEQQREKLITESMATIIIDFNQG
ncbi:hypothetical protein [Kluyvera sp. CRP]|uniref:hypothetical protein n=1 Tax=Kluyvera sp. CRP TaxID=2873269 RepID=UPI001CC1D2D5|nr:hypothetical protein [Kluyvera sp. CRP]UAK20251.1 hypothetical protein K7B04_23855 [Kluyvera sp. CRP]